MNPRQITDRASARVILGALIVGMLLAFAPNQAAAQCPDRVVEEVQRTEQALTEIRERLREHAADMPTLSSASVERAKSLLTIAFKLQEEAKRLAGAGQCKAALEFTMDARQKARAALGSLSVTNETEPSLERQLMRTDEMLAHLKEIFPVDAPRPANAQLRRAHEIQRKAWETFRSGHPRMAAKLTREAQNIARKLQRELRGGDRASERFADNAERLKAALQRMEESGSKCTGEAQELIARARKALAEALALHEDRHFRQAETALRLANELGHKARALCGSGERVEQRIEALAEKAEVLAEEAEGNDEALRLIDSVRGNIAEAQKLLDDGLPAAAAGQLGAASMLLRQAEKLLNQ